MMCVSLCSTSPGSSVWKLQHWSVSANKVCYLLFMNLLSKYIVDILYLLRYTIHKGISCMAYTQTLHSSLTQTHNHRNKSL